MDNERTYWDKAMRRRLSRRKLLQAGAIAGAGVAAGLPLSACTPSQPQQSPTPSAGQTPQAAQPKYGGVLKLGYPAGNGYLYPGVARNSTDPNFMLVFGDSIVYSAPVGTPDPEASLAASWKRENDTTILFTLRQGIKFHDGTDYDAKAQKDYFDYLLDPQRSKQFGYRGMIESIRETEAVDKYTLRLRLSRADPGLLINLGGQAGFPVSPTAIDKLGPDIIAKPVMTGPFTVKSFNPGGEWVFEKNPNYWRKGLPYLDGITFVEIPDERVRAASLQSGQIDVAFFASPGEITERLRQDPNLVSAAAQDGPASLYINHALPPLDNLKLRQAVAHCVDREAIAKAVYQGTVQAAKGQLSPPGTWAFKDLSDVIYKFDINRAKELIKESGMKTPIPLKMICRESPVDSPPTAQLLKGWLDEAGFEINLEFASQPEATRRMLDETSYHLSPSGVGTRPDPDGQFVNFVTSVGYYNSGRKSQDPAQKQVDDLAQRGGNTYDQAERKKFYDEMQVVLAKNVIAHIPMIYRVYVGAFRKNVKGTEQFWNIAWGTFRPQFLWKE